MNPRDSQYRNIIALWQSFNVTTEADIDLRLDNFRVLFAYNSARIENDAVTLHDMREIFENGQVLNFTGNPRALFELQNQRICYDFLRPKLAAREPLSLELLKNVHEALTSGTYDERRFIQNGERPGQFKKHDYVTGRHEAGSPPDDVEADLTELLDELYDYHGRDILTAAAYFHARFENIHPFADGNGRVGRTLLNYFLMINDHPPIIIHDEEKAEYYAALEQYDADESLMPMREFLQNQTELTWKKTLQRMEQK